MKKYLILFKLLLITLFFSCNNFEIDNNSRTIRNDARQKLIQLSEIENLFMQWDQIYNSERAVTTIYLKDSLIDERIKIRKEINTFLNEFGFPEFDKVGSEYLNKFYLVSTENSLDTSFLKKYLISLNKEFDNNKISKYNYANCLDRITCNLEGKQIYGTLINYNFDIKEFELLVPLKEKKVVNKLRREINLDSIEQFFKESEKYRLLQIKHILGDQITYNS